jgi:hypothetical protein
VVDGQARRTISVPGETGPPATAQMPLLENCPVVPLNCQTWPGLPPHWPAKSM